MHTPPLNRATLVTVTGLAAGAVGLVIQKAAGVEMPPVPPGLIILTLVAALVAVTRRPWTLVLAVLAALAEIPGFVGSAIDADTAGELGGALVRGVGVTTALIAGIAAAVMAYRSPHRSPKSAAR
ncbi:hypothetical protein [Actinomadura rugatobispora]|uniref:Uncharacterized protein n=1 Tax=Actinomadura rugatobispora TaxID=1994 RepID=A0ABW1A3P5_9ACTN|nr:hypothetical protein GCM10010200_106520 [Actinomadura rugatobispora]